MVPNGSRARYQHSRPTAGVESILLSHKAVVLEVQQYASKMPLVDNVIFVGFYATFAALLL